jgi:hypothetical protein
MARFGVILAVCAGAAACSGAGDATIGADPARAPGPGATGDPSPGPGPGADPGPPKPTTRANGAVTAWKTLDPMPVPRANHCMTYASGHVVVVGGNYKPKGSTAFKSIAEVHVAKANDDGTLGAWRVAGTLPSAVNSCTAASDGKRVLVLDGIFDRDADAKKVWSATLEVDGALSAFTSIGALPNGARVLYSDAWVAGGQLLAMRAKLTTEGDAITLLRAPLGASVGTWSESDWLPGFRGHPQYAYTGAFVYALGGYKSDASGLPMQSDVAGAPVAASGAPGASFAATALPKPTGLGVALAVDDYLMSFGGKDEVYAGKGTTDVWTSKVADDGALGAWATQPGMPEGRTNHCAVVGGDFVYVTGGGYDAGGLDNVYSARVRY